jgi:pyruvate kinase
MGELLSAGVNVFRINTAHGTPDLHRELIGRVRRVAGNQPVAVLLDTRGPKVRVGELPEPVEVSPGEEVLLGEGGIPLLPPDAAEAVSPGTRILLADGVLELEVLDRRGRALRCRALRGGIIQSGKGVNFPGAVLPIPALTPEDRATLKLAREEGVDYLALSFVQRPEDIVEAQKILGPDARILAKVELAAAVARMAELLAVADGAMVARGDLGVEIEPYRVPLVQKKLVDLCNVQAKPVIVATQMLQSMVSSPCSHPGGGGRYRQCCLGRSGCPHALRGNRGGEIPGGGGAGDGKSCGGCGKRGCAHPRSGISPGARGRGSRSHCPSGLHYR